MVETIDWPRIVIGDRGFILRETFSTWYLLGKWGLSEAYNELEYAAACCGNFDGKGKWHSADFKRPQDLVDMISDLVGPEAATQAVAAIRAAVADVQGKAQPRQENSPQPAGQTAASTQTDGSAPGPSAPPAAA